MTAKRILVVDDDVQLCQLTSDILEEHGFKTVTANSTDQAFKKLVEMPPDLIVLDARNLFGRFNRAEYDLLGVDSAEKTLHRFDQ